MPLTVKTVLQLYISCIIYAYLEIILTNNSMKYTNQLRRKLIILFLGKHVDV